MEEKRERRDAVRTALEVGRYLLAKGEVACDEVGPAMGVSSVTARRAVLELRSMGADIVTQRGGGRATVYVWRNADACKLRLWAWLDFFEEHNLLTSSSS